MSHWLGRWLGTRARMPPPAAAAGAARTRNPRVADNPVLRRAITEWPGHDQPPAVAAPRLVGCRSWVMQLQAINWERIEASIADVAVIDASADGSLAGTFPAGVVDRMRTKPGGGESLVLCHLSIGVAEPWRPYWNDKWHRARPGWMDSASGDWPGSNRVHYWDERWQKLLLGSPASLLAGILAAGFDGVALSGIDSYAHFRAKGRRSAADDMIELVERIGRAAWASNPNFLIAPIGGEELLASPLYRSVISAVIAEDVLARYDAGEANVLDDLTPALAEDIPVLAVEYLRDDPADATRIPGAVQQLRAHGLVAYIAPRNLDRLAAPEV